MKGSFHENVPQLDLHGKTADEAESAIDRFVNEQIMRQSLTVKIIHGNGRGVLKKTTTDWLKRNSQLIERAVSFGPGFTVELIDVGYLSR